MSRIRRDPGRLIAAASAAVSSTLVVVICRTEFIEIDDTGVTKLSAGRAPRQRRVRNIIVTVSEKTQTNGSDTERDAE